VEISGPAAPRRNFILTAASRTGNLCELALTLTVNGRRLAGRWVAAQTLNEMEQMMTRRLKQLIVFALISTASLALSSIGAGQSGPGSPPASTSSAGKSTATQPDPLLQQLRSLEQQITLQQKEIDQLRMALEKRQKPSAPGNAAPTAHGSTAIASSKAAQPHDVQDYQASSSPQKPGPATPKTDQAEVASAGSLPAGSVPVEASALPSSLEPNGQQNPALSNSPIPAIPLHIGSATLTPVGFVDATEFFRSTNLGSGIGSAFGSLPFSNTVQGRLAENRFTIQNSRIGLQMDSQFGANHVRGYLESDFLGAQPTNAYITSNSDSLRIRLYWVDVNRGKFEFLAGQSWSLLTPGRTGISPVPADIFYSQDMDTNYQVGLTWARQLQFRFVYHASPHVAAAVSLEDPEQYVGTAVTLPPGFNSSQVGTGAATSTPNSFPDVIGKLAFDPEVGGKDMHIELAGLLSSFRTLNTSKQAAREEGGGGSLNLNLELFKNFHLIANSFASRGGGRYIFGLGPDFVVQPDGTPSLVNADSGIGGFEYQATRSTMFYGYYGGAYFGRNFSVIPATTPGGAPTYVGYGYPVETSSSSSQNRAIQEGTFGIIQNFWKNPRYGALQLITQYSYLTRAPWFVAPGSPKNAHLSQAYADIRYVLP
jgi:hypothetical protein